ncbi:alpha/beta hydrolase [Halalkalibacter sp. AB-rgal2]|uniref:alpha/beta hydrolase n=1 Tax=Halalkalibacter sp. AB-rgal2 TaxID=3242695 RepID=UPI00359E6D1F
MIHKKTLLWNDESEAKLMTYVWEHSEELQPNKKRPAVIICPGGAYLGTSDREAEPVALRFMTAGYQTFVLRYTTYYPTFTMDFSQKGREEPVLPQALFDLGKAISKVREHADEWNVDPDQIVLCGFSAGGHLVASMGVHWHESFLQEPISASNEQLKPNALILGYPLTDYLIMKEEAEKEVDEGKRELWRVSNQAVFGKEQPSIEELEGRSPVRFVTEATPPTFIWHTADDDLVYARNALNFATALAKQKVPYELHVFENGVHGLSLSDETTANDPAQINQECEVWVDLALKWLKKRM